MKIAFFTYYPLELGGGVAKYFIEVSTGLKKRYKDLDLSIITFDENTLQKILLLYSIYFVGKQDRHLINKENLKRIKEKLGQVSYFKVGISELKNIFLKYEFIYSTNNLLEVIILKYLIGYRNLPPVIYGFHIPSYYAITSSLQSKLHNVLYSSYMYKLAIKGAYKLHVLNKFDEKLYCKFIQPENVVKIYNPFDFNNFVQKAEVFDYKYNWNKKKFNILWVGRLTEQKGVDDLVVLISLINASEFKNKVVWNIVGDGELKNDIDKVSNKWDNVCYHGYVTNNYLPSIYKNNHLFISTSRWESFPYNLLEAQSFGIPVVSYKIHGCTDIIEDGKNGYLVENINQFKDRVIELLNNKNMEIKFIVNFIKSKFDMEKIYQKVYRLFEL